MTRLRALAGAILTLVLLTAGACTAEGGLGQWTVESTQLGPLSGGEPVEDITGNGHALRKMSGSSGPVRVIDGPDAVGRVLDYPASGRVALRADGPGGLNPGTSEFQVRVVLATNHVDGGANLAQKGLFSTSQYKVQLDGGVPSCRFADTRGRAKLWKGASPHRIDNGAWWEVTCRKEANRVGLRVQRVGGAQQGFTWTNANVGNITSSKPFTVGASGTGCGNDQYRGWIGSVLVQEL